MDRSTTAAAERNAELARLIAEQREDMKAQEHGYTFFPHAGVQLTDNTVPADMETLVEGSGLPGNLRFVTLERLRGRSFEAIARDERLRKPNGERLTRQRVHQLELVAMQRLNVGYRSADQWLTETGIEQAAWMRARGRVCESMRLRAI
ncbi:MAG: hypothetical protein K2R98_16805 [Gemmataceae bacterium]|nr:hypothetical protein [Gemmataceae bacterium]